MYAKLTINDLIDFTKNLRVLYVEDNENAREALLDLMGNFFDDIVVAENGLDGFEKFENNTFDLIVSDLNMPKMNGIEMIKKITAIENNVPIIISTAHKETELLIDCIKYGVDGYLLKPINHKQLMQTIRQVCEKLYYLQETQKYEASLEKLVQERTKELEITQKKLIDMVNRDPMTNLYNRRYFNEVSIVLMNMTKREEKELSVLMIDIDRFKMLNDIYGHQVGDKVIIKLSEVLLELTRKSDVTVRFGGEEFVVLLPDTNIDGASLIAKKIRKTIEDTKMTIEHRKDKIIKFTVSIGVAKYCLDSDEDIDNIVNRADKALYEAKQSGRNKVVIYEKKIL